MPSTGPTKLMPGKPSEQPEPIHDHVAGHDDRHSQYQTQPEIAAKRLRVMPGVLAVALTATMNCAALTHRSVILVVPARVVPQHVCRTRRGTLARRFWSW